MFLCYDIIHYSEHLFSDKNTGPDIFIIRIFFLVKVKFYSKNFKVVILLSLHIMLESKNNIGYLSVF